MSMIRSVEASANGNVATLPSGIIRLAIGSVNVDAFDRDPPFVLLPLIVHQGFIYDLFSPTPMGRFISLQISKGMVAMRLVYLLAILGIFADRPAAASISSAMIVEMREITSVSYRQEVNWR
jgi:hypothetical protein